MKEKKHTKEVHFKLPLYIHQKLKEKTVKNRTTITQVFIEAAIRYVNNKGDNDEEVLTVQK